MLKLRILTSSACKIDLLQNVLTLAWEQQHSYKMLFSTDSFRSFSSQTRSSRHIARQEGRREPVSSAQRFYGIFQGPS